MKINKEMDNSIKAKTKDKKNKNIITHKGSREILNNKAKTRDKKVIELGTRKDKDNRKKRETQKNQKRNKYRALK